MQVGLGWASPSAHADLQILFPSPLSTRLHWPTPVPLGHLSPVLHLPRVPPSALCPSLEEAGCEDCWDLAAQMCGSLMNIDLCSAPVVVCHSCPGPVEVEGHRVRSRQKVTFCIEETGFSGGELGPMVCL